MASASPRRRELLDRTGIEYTVDPADVDESTEISDPKEVVEELSRRKARAVLCKHPDARVIAADTVVSIDGEILGKPSDREEAIAMLTRLSGREHLVFTGVTIASNEESGEVIDTFAECTRVEMYDNSPELISWYVDTGEPMDKAGAYGIQGKGTVLVKSVTGNYDNVVGLPLAALMRRI